MNMRAELDGSYINTLLGWCQGMGEGEVCSEEGEQDESHQQSVQLHTYYSDMGTGTRN